MECQRRGKFFRRVLLVALIILNIISGCGRYVLGGAWGVSLSWGSFEAVPWLMKGHSQDQYCTLRCMHLVSWSGFGRTHCLAFFSFVLFRQCYRMTHPQDDLRLAVGMLLSMVLVSHNHSIARTYLNPVLKSFCLALLARGASHMLLFFYTQQYNNQDYYYGDELSEHYTILQLLLQRDEHLYNNNNAFSIQSLLTVVLVTAFWITTSSTFASSARTSSAQRKTTTTSSNVLKQEHSDLLALVIGVILSTIHLRAIPLRDGETFIQSSFLLLYCWNKLIFQEPTTDKHHGHHGRHNDPLARLPTRIMTSRMSRSRTKEQGRATAQWCLDILFPCMVIIPILVMQLIVLPLSEQWEPLNHYHEQDESQLMTTATRRIHAAGAIPGCLCLAWYLVSWFCLPRPRPPLRVSFGTNSIKRFRSDDVVANSTNTRTTTLQKKGKFQDSSSPYDSPSGRPAKHAL